MSAKRITEPEARAAYLAMGPERSLSALYRHYSSTMPKGSKPPALITIKGWSAKQGWQALAAEHDKRSTERAVAKLESKQADQMRIEESRIASQKEIAAMQVAATAAAAKDKLSRQSEMEGVRIGMDAAKHRAQMAVQQAQRAAQKTPSKPKKE